MRIKLLVSAGAVVALSTISIMAYAKTPIINDVPIEKETVQITAVPLTFEEEIVADEPQITVQVMKLRKNEVPDIELSKEERYLLAKLAMSEAGDQDIEGKALVMRVVLNRVSSDKFPESVKEVIFQKHQFSPISDGRYFELEPNEDCWTALDLITEDGWNESEDALYFESESESTWHHDNLQFLFQHGDHYFYTDKED